MTCSVPGHYNYILKAIHWEREYIEAMWSDNIRVFFFFLLEFPGQ